MNIISARRYYIPASIWDASHWDASNWNASHWHDSPSLPGGTFTHYVYSEAWHTTSWLDHCISTSDGDEIINSISIDYSLNNADHLPVCIDLALQRIPEIVVDNSTRQRGLAWDKINDDDRTKYCDLSDANLLRIPIPHDALRCIDANCTNVNHRNDLNKFYGNITESMSKA